MADINITALRNVIRALRESPHPDEFDMTSYVADDGCGSPACCFGHYASRADLQNEFELYGRYVRLTRGRIWVAEFDASGPRCNVEFDEDPVLEHFGIGVRDAHKLFAPMGCGGAKTIAAAISYIEAFIEEKTNAAHP